LAKYKVTNYCCPAWDKWPLAKVKGISLTLFVVLQVSQKLRQIIKDKLLLVYSTSTS